MKRHAATFLCVARDLLERGHSVQFSAEGASMLPKIRHGDILTVAPTNAGAIAAGQIVLCEDQNCRPLVHRIIEIRRGVWEAVVVLRGDAKTSRDATIGIRRVLGKVVSIERHRLRDLVRRWRRIVTLLSY